MIINHFLFLLTLACEELRAEAKFPQFFSKIAPLSRKIKPMDAHAIAVGLELFACAIVTFSLKFNERKINDKRVNMGNGFGLLEECAISIFDVCFTPLGITLIVIFLGIIIAISVNKIRKSILFLFTTLRFFIHIHLNETHFESWLYKQPYKKRKRYDPIIMRAVAWPRAAVEFLTKHYVLVFAFMLLLFVFGFWGWQNVRKPFTDGREFIIGEEGYKLHKNALTNQLKKCKQLEDVSVESIAGCSAPIAQPTLELRNILLGLLALLALPFFFVRMWITERNT